MSTPEYHESATSGTVYSYACAWRAVGAQVLPVSEDGLKTPDHLIPSPTNDPSAPRASWARHRKTWIPDEVIGEVFGNGSARTGMGVVTGVGFRPDGLKIGMIECDDPDLIGELLHRIDQADAAGVSVPRRVFREGYVVRSAGGGLHAYYWAADVPPNTKLACVPAPTETNPRAVKVLIETRGAGGYAITAPSHGSVHPSGNQYEVIVGTVDDIPTLTADDQDELFSFMRSFDKRPLKEAGPETKTEVKIEGSRPGDHYNADATVEIFRELLSDWEWLFESGGEWYLRRPGKDRGISATWNFGGFGMLRVFTSSTMLEPKMYKAFSLLAQLQYGGDYAACARDLHEKGYGQRGHGPQLVFEDDPAGDSDEPSRGLRAVKLSEELSAGSDNRFYAKVGFDTVAITNFVAWITADISEEIAPGEIVGRLTIEGRLASGVALPAIEVLASDFAAMAWLSTSGPSWRRAIIGAGADKRDKVRAAIQLESERRGVREGHRFRETGWHEHPHGFRIFTFHGNAMGPDGYCNDVDARLDAGHERYVLPEPMAGDQLTSDATRYLRSFDLTSDPLAAALLSAPARAIISAIIPVDFGIFLVGKTGSFKSELTALVLAHFGQTFTRTTIGLNFESTANSIEAALWHSMHVVAGLDDFAPAGSRYQVEGTFAMLERILRGIGNISGRGRLTPDATAKRTYFPRGLVIASGEDLPRGQSATARVQVIEVSRSMVSTSVLSECQAMAKDGVYARLTASFIQAIARNWTGVSKKITDLHEHALERMRAKPFAHARTGDAIAGQVVALQCWLDFIRRTGAITEVEQDVLYHRLQTGLIANGIAQGEALVENDPCTLFTSYVRSAVASGDAHLADRESGGCPRQSQRFGWRAKSIRTRDGLEWIEEEKGRRIGWVDLDSDALFLDPDAAFAVAQDLGSRVGKTMPTTVTTLGKRLVDNKLIVSTESGRTKQKIYVVRQSQRVWHLRLSEVFPEAEPGDLEYEPIPFNQLGVAS